VIHLLSLFYSSFKNRPKVLGKVNDALAKRLKRAGGGSPKHQQALFMLLGHNFVKDNYPDRKFDPSVVVSSSARPRIYVYALFAREMNRTAKCLSFLFILHLALLVNLLSEQKDFRKKKKTIKLTCSRMRKGELRIEKYRQSGLLCTPQNFENS
jgi:hypothetical protein